MEQFMMLIKSTTLDRGGNWQREGERVRGKNR